MTAERSRTFHLPLQALAGLFIAIAACAYTACSNSESVGNINGGETSPTESAFNVHETADSTTPASEAQQDQPPSITKYIPLDDTEYPYAGIPRIVIETENRREIKDRETEIPARLQIWGEKAPESEIMELTIRGRGNSSWTEMPKKSYKIEFCEKQSILGMPPNKDWALVSNYADKTLLNNHLIYQLAKRISFPLAPRSKFAELYLNNEYLGVYLLTETIKFGKERLNIFNKDNAYLVEFDIKPQQKDISFQSASGKKFTLHSPKNSNLANLNILVEHLNHLENFLTGNITTQTNHINKWFNTKKYLSHYWIQEFSHNRDGAFVTSVYFSWEPNKPIEMGPVWDFDYAINVWNNSYIGWATRNQYWNKYLFKDSIFQIQAIETWNELRPLFISTIDSLSFYKKKYSKAIQNNFKKWDILNSSKYIYQTELFYSYNDAINASKEWIKKRIDWIDNNIQQ